MPDNQNNRNFALVYMDFAEGKPYWYVRLGGLETNRFPHGLGLASKFIVKQNAEDFADEVEAYMKQIVNSFKTKQK